MGDERAVVRLVVSSLWRVGLVSGVVSATAAVKHPVGCWHVHVCAADLPMPEAGRRILRWPRLRGRQGHGGGCYGEILWSRHLWFVKYLWDLDNASAARHIMLQIWLFFCFLQMFGAGWCKGPDFILFCRGSGFAASSEQATWVLAWVSRRISEVVQVVIFEICEFFLDRNGLRGRLCFVGLICL